MAHILDNIVYRGHTLGLRTTTVSYKNKAEVKRPESEQALVENTHEPLVSQELWEIVREVRRHKRRAPKHMEEPGLFSGLVYCAGYLVLCRTEKMREDQYYFRCSTYGKKGKAFCTPHQILERDLKAIVLDDLKRSHTSPGRRSGSLPSTSSRRTAPSCAGRSPDCKRN